MVFKAALLIFTVAVVSASNDDLIAVAQVFRHGQRTPSSFLGADPYSDLDTYWGGLDYGQLTNVGKRQHFALGQFTRKRYSDWLPKTYNKDDIYVQTTDVERTHMSAQANLYGLYPASGSQVWRKNVDWQPIPIHPSDNRVLVYSGSNCPVYNKVQANVTSEGEFLTLDSTYASLYEYISNYTNTTVTTFVEASSIYDALKIEEQIGLSLPSWVSAIYPEPIETLATKTFESYSYNTLLKRLGTGVLLNTIIEYFEGMAEDSTSSQKYQIYSCHDNNVFSILDIVGQTPDKPVPFATSIWFELRKINFINVVQLWLKSGDDFTQLSINGCALNCPLTKVKTLLSDILLDVDTYDEECNATV